MGISFIAEPKEPQNSGRLNGRAMEASLNKLADQPDLFEAPKFHTLSELVDSRGKPALILIGCSRSKLRRAAIARSMYTSERFRTALAISDSLGARFFILSAKHGLLDPNEVIEPYDVDLNEFTSSARARWAAKVCKTLTKHLNVRNVCILAEDAYAAPVASALKKAVDGNPKISSPLSRIDSRFYPAWHTQALHATQRLSDLRKLYDLVDVARSKANSFLLGDLPSRKLPDRGVYIFLDPDERNFAGSRGRIVRIGTHAISEGSKSLLRTRLRAHLGQLDRSGNHRASIFRLHVGRAILERDFGQKRLSTWGVGQDAPKRVRALELKHEKRVSEYLARLEVVVLPVSDAANKYSLRSVVERQLIALCSESLQPIDHASKAWLGRHSPSSLIVKSGLWNLRDVGSQYDPDGVGSVSDILKMTEWLR